MTGSLPWGWLNAAAPVMPGTEHQHDDVTLRPDERLRLGSIVAGWDDTVLCNASARCRREAVWVWHCQCGAPWYGCNTHRSSADAVNQPGAYECVKCSTPVPCPIPWLPL